MEYNDNNINVDNEYLSKLNKIDYHAKEFLKETIEELLEKEINSMINAKDENSTNQNRGAIRILNQFKKHLGIN